MNQLGTSCGYCHVILQCIKYQLESLCWFSQRRSPVPHFGGCAPRGLWPPLWTRPRFLYNAPTLKFHHPMFTCLEVIVLTNTQTNKQTDATENIDRLSLYATTLGKKRKTNAVCLWRFKVMTKLIQWAIGSYWSLLNHFAYLFFS